jgi:hypothetical protein
MPTETSTETIMIYILATFISLLLLRWFLGIDTIIKELKNQNTILTELYKESLNKKNDSKKSIEQ